MSVEIYHMVNGEQIQRLIGRTDTVQARLKAEARWRSRMMQRELNRSRSRTRPEDIADARGRRRTRIYTSKGQFIDHYVNVEGPVASGPHASKRLTEILKAGGYDKGTR